MDVKRRRFLVIEPHSDDFGFGAGGTAAKLVSQQWDGAVLLISASDIDFEHSSAVVTKEVRIEEHEKVCNFLEVISANRKFNLPVLDTESQLDTVPVKRVVNLIEGAIDAWKPEILFCFAPSFHQDHRKVWESCMAAVRPTRKFFVKKILVGELPTYFFNPRQYDFHPHVFEDITDFLEVKLKAVKLYESQVRQENNYLSLSKIEELAMIRGFHANCKFAESFEVVRYIK